MQSQPSEKVALLSVIDPDNYAGTNTVVGDVIDMSKWGALMAIALQGAMETNGTADYKLQAGTATNSTFYDITGKAITQFTKAGTDDDKQAIINLRAEELAAQSKTDSRTYRYVRDIYTPGTVTGDFAAVVCGFNPRFAPASDDDLSSVDEIVT
jgi:hypothetical protein